MAVGFILLAGACNGGATPTSSGSRQQYAIPSSVAWADCGQGFQCGGLTVPLDYSNPTGDTIKIALIRRQAMDQATRIGSLVINPGGPGLSGIEYLRNAAHGMAHLNTRFDLVSFDPRGAGQSAPVRCLSGPQMDDFTALDTVLDDEQEKQAFTRAAMALARTCEQKSSKILPFVDTASIARDVDIIRAALGDAKLTYLGFSYGTFLGETYAHLFPTHVRALALDAVLDPAVNLIGPEGLLQVSAALEMNLQAFLAYCRGNLSCQYGTSGDPGAKLPGLMQRLDNKPTPVGKRMLTRALAMSGVLNTLYDPRAWSTLDSALSAADQGNGQLLLTLADLRVRRHADGSYENFLDATAAITCLDHPIPWDIATYHQLGPALANASPLFGPTFQYTSYLACSNWPIKPKGTVAALSADGAPPILLVDATGDLSPYVWAQAVNKQLGGSVLLTRNGFGHVSYDKSSCARQAEDAYLIDLTLPAPGTVCESDFQ